MIKLNEGKVGPKAKQANQTKDVNWKVTQGP
jgi:hypothetical protein